VTEAEWLACADPREMLGLLKGRASDRKTRLLAVAFCRQAWGLLAAAGAGDAGARGAPGRARRAGPQAAGGGDLAAGRVRDALAVLPKEG
jgi:hypothetical protein